MKLAGKVRPGDAIEWCGRVVTVEKVGNALHQWTRPAVYLWCRIDGAMKRLHYYADEPVDVREADSEPPAEPACEVRGGTGMAPNPAYSVLGQGSNTNAFLPCPRGCREGR